MSLPARLLRHHRPHAGTVLLGVLIVDSGMVRSTAVAEAATSVPSVDDPGERALVVRRLADQLDLSHRRTLQLSGLVCRHGPTVWLPVDLAWRSAIGQEAQDRGLRRGPVHLLTEHGWRDDRDDAGRRPCIPAPQPPWW